MKNINNRLLEEQDVIIEKEIMKNGENRLRIKMHDNSMVCFSKAQGKAKWQNAHYHKFVRELYIVQSGKIILAVQDKDHKVTYKLLNEGETYMVEPGVKHNAFLSKEASTCVIKYGKNIKEDNNANYVLLYSFLFLKTSLLTKT